MNNPDAIVVEKNKETNKYDELWITIADVADLLNHSETHIWRLVKQYGWETKKDLQDGRKKSFLLRSNIENYHKEINSRQKRDPLTQNSQNPSEQTSGNMATLQKLTTIDFSDIPRIKSLVVEFVEDHKKILNDLEENRKETISIEKSATKWRVSTLFLSILCVVSAGILALWLLDTKSIVKAKEQAITDLSNEVNNVRSQLEKTLLEFSITQKSTSDFNTSMFDRQEVPHLGLTQSFDSVLRQKSKGE